MPTSPPLGAWHTFPPLDFKASTAAHGMEEAGLLSRASHIPVECTRTVISERLIIYLHRSKGHRQTYAGRGRIDIERRKADGAALI